MKPPFELKDIKHGEFSYSTKRKLKSAVDEETGEIFLWKRKSEEQEGSVLLGQVLKVRKKYCPAKACGFSEEGEQKRIMKLLILIIILSGCISGVKVAAPVVEAGDTVSINYVAKIDGAVFDTEPLNFTVGEGFMIPAIEEAVLGMKVGEEKTVVVPPEKGYGERNESLVRSMSRFVIIPREIEISIERFRFSYNKEPVLNDTVEDIYWTSRVIKVNDTVVVRYEHLSIVRETQNGKIKIDSNDTSVIMEYIPILNITFQTAVGEYATVIDSNETSMTVDYNHPFAGKTLVFLVKVEEIKKVKP